MKSIQPFIDLGWHTVPLKGQLKRLEDGDKTTPQFEKGWKDKYMSKALDDYLFGNISLGSKPDIKEGFHRETS